MDMGHNGRRESSEHPVRSYISLSFASWRWWDDHRTWRAL